MQPENNPPVGNEGQQPDGIVPPTPMQPPMPPQSASPTAPIPMATEQAPAPPIEPVAPSMEPTPVPGVPPAPVPAPMVPTQPAAEVGYDTTQKSSNTGLIVGVIIGGAVLFLGVVGVIVFLAVQGASKSSVAPKTDTTTTQSADDIDTPTDDTPAPVSDTPAGEKKVGETITDPEFAYAITVNKVRYGVPIDSDLSGLANSYNGVAIEVTAKNATKKYYNSLYSSSFKLVSGTDDDYTNETAFDEYIKKQDLQVFKSVAPGKSATGWVFFYTKKENKTFSFRYARNMYRVVGGDGGTIPAKNFDIKLP